MNCLHTDFAFYLAEPNIICWGSASPSLTTATQGGTARELAQVEASRLSARTGFWLSLPLVPEVPSGRVESRRPGKSPRPGGPGRQDRTPDNYGGKKGGTRSPRACAFSGEAAGGVGGRIETDPDCGGGLEGMVVVVGASHSPTVVFFVNRLVLRTTCSKEYG